MNAVSRIINGSANDILAGTVLGVLPDGSPSYDVEVRIASINYSDAAYNILADHYSATLLVNGTAVLERSRCYNGDYREPSSDGPLATFNAGPGSRLTLNLEAMGLATEAAVYVEARANGGNPGIISTGHYAAQQLSAGSNVLDVLQGTPIGQVPRFGSLWSVIVQTVTVARNSDPLGFANIANMSLLVDGETVCENFVIPRIQGISFGASDPANQNSQFRFVNQRWPVEERDTTVTFLATAGSRITMNLSSQRGTQVHYRVFATPVS